MSHHNGIARNPKTGNIEKALFVDDFFGRHQYGVTFYGDDEYYTPSEVIASEMELLEERDHWRGVAEGMQVGFENIPVSQGYMDDREAQAGPLVERLVGVYTINGWKNPDPRPSPPIQQEAAFALENHVLAKRRLAEIAEQKAKAAEEACDRAEADMTYEESYWSELASADRLRYEAQACRLAAELLEEVAE